jgi:glycine hydroxymethyltransferase
MFVDKDVTHSTGTPTRPAGRVEPFLASRPASDAYHRGLAQELRAVDPEVHRWIAAEFNRLSDSLQLIAAENRCSRAVLAALGSVVQNKTTEGFAGCRFHGGCEVVDQIERLAIERAKQVFGARYANVQPHSGTAANHIVFTALLNPDDVILHLAMDQGGHVSHGASVSFTGRFFRTEPYTVDRCTYLLDYDAIRQQALQTRPKLIVCGASAYSRTIDFARFRAIADEVGAYLMADVSHIAGLIAAGVHPSPIDQAHFTTTSTYKPGGPRGGLILMGRDCDRPFTAGSRTRPLWEQVDKATFPGFQGTPHLNNIAAKAVFFNEMMTDEYRGRQARIVENAHVLAQALTHLGFDVLTGGTDNHMALVNVSRFREGLTGAVAQRALEDCGIAVNMNRLPYDPRPQAVTSGLRVGTPIVTRNGMGPQQMPPIAEMLWEVLDHVHPNGDRSFDLDESFRAEMRQRVLHLCRQFPLE